MRLEHQTGIFNLVTTPDLNQKIRRTILNGPLLEVHGRLESREGVYNIKVTHADALQSHEQKMIGTSPRQLSIFE